MSKQQVGNKYMAKDFFAYVIGPFDELAAGNQLPGNVTIDADADFLWQKLTCFADEASAGATESTQVVPGVTITIKDTSSGRDLMNGPIPLPALCGDGQLPFILPTPKIFQARGTIAINLANITAATSYTNLYVVFIGTKLFLS
jgi:hypothetical protein